MSKIYHLDELEEFFGGEKWKLSIDVTDIWNNHNDNKTSMLEFNNLYRNRLLEYKKEILQLGNDVWNDLVPLLNKMNEKKKDEELYSVYDDIYSWGDKNDVHIKTK